MYPFSNVEKKGEKVSFVNKIRRKKVIFNKDMSVLDRIEEVGQRVSRCYTY